MIDEFNAVTITSFFKRHLKKMLNYGQKLNVL